MKNGVDLVFFLMLKSLIIIIYTCMTRILFKYEKVCIAHLQVMFFFLVIYCTVHDIAQSV